MKKPATASLLGAILRDYFMDHLPRIRGSSPHTIHSYRDAIALLLRFIAEQRKVPVATLDLADLDPPRILAFLSHLEDQRNNGVATRNVRLAAIHAFFRFVASRNPEQLDHAQRVIAVPFKRAPNRAIAFGSAGHLVALDRRELGPLTLRSVSGLSTATRLAKMFVPTARPPVA